MTLLNGYNARAKWRGKNGDGERWKKKEHSIRCKMMEMTTTVTTATEQRWAIG